MLSLCSLDPSDSWHASHSSRRSMVPSRSIKCRHMNTSNNHRKHSNRHIVSQGHSARDWSDTFVRDCYQKHTLVQGFQAGWGSAEGCKASDPTDTKLQCLGTPATVAR
mmetsp:Transcript_11125/g.17484  ORF Transcript_11125/g.17484 Transcript_11125/m.17484 type:complete len:108 (-) Transcript_11125:136-459(-)